MKRLIPIVAAAICSFYACKNNRGSTTNQSDNSTAASATERNRQTALNAAKAYSNRNVDGAFKDCSSNYKEYGSDQPQPTKNLDSLKIHMKEFFNAFPDFKGGDFHAVADSNTVVIIGDWSGTFKKVYRKIAPTGKSFKITDADIFTFNNAGKITSHRSIQSEITFLYQLGVQMPGKK